MNFQPLKYIYKPSENPEAKTLLLLHGTGGNEKDLLPLADSFGSDINILSLRGNISENGMPRFFRRLGMGIFDEKDLEFRTHEMIHFLKELAVTEGFDSSKIIALGYSNGANIASAVLVLQPDFLEGAILFRPMQPFRYWNNGLHSKPIPVFISSGTTDTTVDTNDTKSYVALLKASGFEVTQHETEAGHNLTQQDLDVAIQWFQHNFY